MVHRTAYTIMANSADVEVFENVKPRKWTFWDSWKLRRRIKKEAREAAKETLENIKRIMRGE